MIHGVMDIEKSQLDFEFIADANRLYRGMAERDMRTVTVDYPQAGGYALGTVEVVQLPPTRKSPGGVLLVCSEVVPFDEDGQLAIRDMSRRVAVLPYGKDAEFLGVSAGESSGRVPLLGWLAVRLNPERYRTPPRQAGYYAVSLVAKGLKAIEDAKERNI